MARKPVPVSLSERTIFFLDELKKSGRYGETRAEIMRSFILYGIGRAQDAEHIERPKTSIEGIPAPLSPEDEQKDKG